MDESPSSPAPATSIASARLTSTGVIALVVSLVTTAAGLVLLSGPIFSTGTLALILLGLARVAARRHLLGTTVQRDLPPRGRTGESFPVEIRIIPGPAFPGGMSIVFRDPLASTEGAKLIVPGRTRSPSALRYTGKSSRRGHHRPGPWTMVSTWPLGLFATEWSGPFCDSEALLLHPKPFFPQALHTRLQQLVLEAIENSTEPADPVSDFRLLREFRPGDTVKRIHWPASLRSRRLQVAELEPPHPKPRHYGIFLHAYEPAGQILTPDTFELILRIAAGLLQRFQNEEIPILFQHYPDRATSLTHRSEITRTLDHIAICQRRPLAILEPLAAAARDFRHCDEVFLLSDCPRREWEVALYRFFPVSTCIDATSLSSYSQAGMQKRLRLPA